MPANGHQDDTVATDAPAQQALDRARAALRQNQWDLAARWCAQALSEDPDLEGAIELDAVLACQRGDFTAGIGAFRQLTQRNPRSDTAWFNLGKALIETRQMKAGLLALEKALGLNHRHLEARVLLGQAQRDLEHLNAAADTLGQALKQDPGHVPAMQALGAVEAFRGRHAEAAELFGRVLKLRPGAPVAHYNLGRALLALGDAPRAAEHFRTALTINHHYREARLGLGEAAEAQQQWDEALNHYRRLVRRHADFMAAAERLLALLIARNRVGEARLQWEQLWPPGEPSGALWEARILAAENRAEEALECLRGLDRQSLPEPLADQVARELAKLS